MEHSYSQSTPSQYYTPKKYSQTAQRQDHYKTEKSTAQRYYDLEESFKKYQELLEQNLYLKNIRFKENMADKTNPINDTFSYIPPEQPHRSDHSEHKMGRNCSSKCLSTKFENSQSTQMGSNQEAHHQYHIQHNDMRMWSLKHRNNFLQQKLHNLQHQYHKQNKIIHTVKRSQKWKNRFDCKQYTCYQDKYIKLLRVRSPVLLD